jgi:serine/threonine-protein kinase
MRVLLGCICAGGLLGPARAQEDPQALAAQARKVLETNCYRCHGEKGAKKGGFSFALDVPRMVKESYIVPRQPDKSLLVQRVTGAGSNDVMPPPTEKVRPSPEDIQVLRRWVLAGAPDFATLATPSPSAARPFLTERDTLQAMLDHLTRADKLHPGSARYVRFLTLTHLYNNSAVPDERLRLVRAGVAKLLNSLHWKNRVVLPAAADKQTTVLAFDLRDVDWDLNAGWSRLAFRWGKGPGAHAGDPYALVYDKGGDDKDLHDLAHKVYVLSGTRAPALRGDWFLATASVPPLYHHLLGLPGTAHELEQQLKVDVAANFRRDKVVRAGLTASGVSTKGNRLVERHESPFGVYWKSYDFKSSEGGRDLLKLPLGPIDLYPAGKHPYAEQAFTHDGGEIVFSLPNGLHGYLLTDGKGKRLDEAPTDLVRDLGEAAGRGPAIVNGLSCMACHPQGIKGLSDSVRVGTTVHGTALDKVRRLYVPEAEVKWLLKHDEAAYVRALEKVVGSILKVGPDQAKDLKLFPEPVSAVATPYLKGDVSLEEAALELGLRDPKELRQAVQKSPHLRDDLGLKPWLQGGTVKRRTWESVQGQYSAFQEVAAELHRGTPYVVGSP